MKYRLDLGYIGTNFIGWQAQHMPGTVQAAVEQALAVYLREQVHVKAASRTDSGVHAEHQVVVFRSDQSLDAAKTLKGLAALSPTDIWYQALFPVADDFHPIRNARAKVYRYRLWNHARQHAMLRPFAYHVPSTLDIAAMRRAAGYLLGEHDFSAFCAVDSGAVTKVRILDEIIIDERAPLIDIWFRGQGFLKQMVRNLVGTLVAVGQKRFSPEDIPPILLSLDRRKAGPCAPALGLSLVRIFYGDQSSCASLLAEAKNGFAMTIAFANEAE